MLRHYHSGDENGVIDLWNVACPSDPISMKLFTNRVLADPNFDPEGLLIYEANGKIIGALLAIVRKHPLSGCDLESDKGWITAFFVEPSVRCRGIASEMMGGAEAFFRIRGRRQIYFSSYAPNYFVPGIDGKDYPSGKRLLEKQGFRVLEAAMAMDKNLVGYSYPEEIRELEKTRIREGFSFEFLTPRYLSEVIRFSDEAFNPDWARAIREVVSRGFELDHVLIARLGERVLGFCMYGVYDGVRERFGPFGVDPESRGVGLGKILLYKCLHVMRSNGLHNAWFLWADEQSPASHLYFRAGFQATRRFEIMMKVLQ